MSSRIGRKYASEVYPVSRGVGSVTAFARNFGQGPVAPRLVDGAQIEIVWGTIEQGAEPNSNVIVTPRVTGNLVVNGVVNVTNASGGAVQVTVQVGVNDAPDAVPASTTTLSAPPGNVAIPIQALIAGRAVGVAVGINVFVGTGTPDQVTLIANGSTLSVQEVGPATG